ncbi:interleukin-10 receptor subunit beta-like isoform X2 [Megalops cyprinoides]|uniref:interleukin-10 receptor subunit beta-like isoform X2 n=1 Tax=Megalops cyprinoides TaxID=118141 RepID=UPI0018643F64|nr:interleukin-10 receptor subunit beta-like isoform X2 [Megalops cyprinoides]
MTFTFLSKNCFLLVLCTTAVVATVPEPKNVRATSINFGMVLEWEAPRDAPGNLTYSVEFWSYSSGFIPWCSNIHETRCDFSKNLSVFGVHKFRVRAELQEETSPWVETPEFSIDKHTQIGAPTVKLISKEGDIEVEIQDPDMRNQELRNVYSRVSYNIRYWKEDEADKFSMLNDQLQNRVVLLQLEPWTRYCVQAQVYILYSEKRGEFSKAVCETSTTDGKVKPWVTALVMLGSMVVVMGTVMVIFFAALYGYKAIKFLYPSVKLPEHFKQYLIEPPHSYIFLAMQNSPQPEEQCHEVFIVSEATESSATKEGTPL